MDPNATPNTMPEPQPIAQAAPTPPVVPTPVTAAPPAAAPAAAGPAWAQYMGQIVRSQDGTCWLVEADGRHWIETGGIYESLVHNKGAQVFNLAQPDLDKIPEIKGSNATA
jgi:hypothetical protein